MLLQAIAGGSADEMGKGVISLNWVESLQRSFFLNPAWDEARLADLISGNLGARAELLDADRADGKLPSCYKGI